MFTLFVEAHGPPLMGRGLGWALDAGNSGQTGPIAEVYVR